MKTEHILVINKAAGVLMHIHLDRARSYLSKRRSTLLRKKTNQYYDFHPVHRLDKGHLWNCYHYYKTSVNYNMRLIKSIHTSINVTMPSLRENFPLLPLTINWPMGRKPGSIIERCCTNEGKAARTDIRLLKHTTINGEEYYYYSNPLVIVTLLLVVKLWLIKKFKAALHARAVLITWGAPIRFGFISLN